MPSMPEMPVANLDAIPGGHGYPTVRHGVETGRAPAAVRREIRGRALALAVGAVVMVAFLIRLLAAVRLSSHVDEPSSILAAHAVADRGLPILPSGTVYLQGATLSYLLLPFVWLGRAELDTLVMMRVVSVLAGTAAVYLSYRLGRYVTGDSWIGTLTAVLVALDPVGVQWSGHVRMYALLQALTVGLAWTFIHLLTRGATPRRCVVVACLCWTAVFTHVGASLLVVAMGIAAIAVYRQALLRQPGLVSTLVLCALAPVTLLALNHVLGTASVSAQSQGSGSLLTFVGDNLLAPLARLQVSPADWKWGTLVRPATLAWLVPGLTVACSTGIGSWLLLRRYRARVPAEPRYAVITLVSLYWVTVVAVGLLTVSPKERYLLHVHTVAYVLVAVVLADLMRRPRGRAGVARAVVCTLVVTAVGSGMLWRLQEPTVHPDYIAAMAYVEAHRQPEQPVVVALPAVGYLAIGESASADLYFLAGSQDRPRAQRYTRWGDDGRLIDYWIGVDSIVTADQLRRFLLHYPDTWVVVDEERLGADWAYAGAIEQVLRDVTEPVFRGPGGSLVLRPGS